MTEGEKLILLKQDIGIATGAKDEYLGHLLQLGDKEMQREGINKEDSVEYNGLNIQYAAYLFRKRAGTETMMPRSLRWGLNNLLFSQKANGNETEEAV